jgi:hypothetical protein
MIRKARTVRDAKAEPTPQGGNIAVEIKVRDLGPYMSMSNQEVILTRYGAHA